MGIDRWVDPSSTGTATAHTTPYGAGQIGGPPVVVRRSADSGSLTANTTCASDDTLLFAIAASEVWFVEAFLLITAANATMDFKMQWAVPAAATGAWGALSTPNTNMASWGPTTTGNTPGALSALNSALSVGTIAGTIASSFAGYVVNSTTAGNVNLQWAQATSDPGALKLAANSFIRAQRLA